MFIQMENKEKWGNKIYLHLLLQLLIKIKLNLISLLCRGCHAFFCREFKSILIFNCKKFKANWNYFFISRIQWDFHQLVKRKWDFVIICQFLFGKVCTVNLKEKEKTVGDKRRQGMWRINRNFHASIRAEIFSLGLWCIYVSSGVLRAIKHALCACKVTIKNEIKNVLSLCPLWQGNAPIWSALAWPTLGLAMNLSIGRVHLHTTPGGTGESI